MVDFVTLILVIIMLIFNIFLFLSLKTSSNRKFEKEVQLKLSELDKSLSRLEGNLKDEFSRNREETYKNNKILRDELNSSFKQLSDSLLSRIYELSNLQRSQLDIFSTQISKALKSFEDQFLKSVTDFNEIQKEKFNELSSKQSELISATEVKLEKMRETVDEKLHRTLEQRLGESFKLVSERLDLVHKGLGEMQNLATGVGDLKKVLSNVKTRGILGEIQLERILEQLLTTDQYDKNIVTKKGSRDNVEFAIRLPGKDLTEVVHLPIDSKFPLDNYNNLLDAYDSGNQATIDEASKILENGIKKCAKDIYDKYIDPPNTTDFAIMFLPVEGLYAEVARRTNLLETIQREYKINITGPTTLSALLNSLQMGFRTLAIEKRSSEVWKVLGAVKTEFEKFGVVLNKAQEKINAASIEIDTLVGTRTRQIQRKLKGVESLTDSECAVYLNEEN